MTVYKKTMQKYEEKTKETCQNGKICGNDKPKRPFYHLKYKKPQKKTHPDIPHEMEMPGFHIYLL